MLAVILDIARAVRGKATVSKIQDQCTARLLYSARKGHKFRCDGKCTFHLIQL